MGGQPQSGFRKGQELQSPSPPTEPQKPETPKVHFSDFKMDFGGFGVQGSAGGLGDCKSRVTQKWLSTLVWSLFTPCWATTESPNSPPPETAKKAEKGRKRVENWVWVLFSPHSSCQDVPALLTESKWLKVMDNNVKSTERKYPKSTETNWESMRICGKPESLWNCQERASEISHGRWGETTPKNKQVYMKGGQTPPRTLWHINITSEKS